MSFNRIPDEYVAVPWEAMRDFVGAAAEVAGLSEQRARLLADLLTTNDLRGVFSHGTHQIAEYARLMRAGELNADPQITTMRETPTSLLVDGDGGLGYFPSYEGTLAVVEKARKQGIGVVATRNHGHFGAAGLYARMTLEHDMIAFVTSGHQLDLEPGEPLIYAGGGSPMSFSAPADEEVSLVLDFGALHGLFRERGEKIAEMAPGLFLRCMGMAEICQAWGGLLTGLTMDPKTRPWTYSGANQGALIIAARIDLFAEPAEFKREMDEYVRRVGTLKPLEGYDQAFMPGGLEADREQRHREQGIPVSNRHRARLQRAADELELEVPWEK